MSKNSSMRACAYTCVRVRGGASRDVGATASQSCILLFDFTSVSQLTKMTTAKRDSNAADKAQRAATASKGEQEKRKKSTGDDGVVVASKTKRFGRTSFWLSAAAVLIVAVVYAMQNPDCALYKSVPWRRLLQGTRRSVLRISGKTFSRPLPLLSYAQYNERFPRFKRAHTKHSEVSHRQLIFGADVGVLGKHNLAFVGGDTSYAVAQSPFKSDRTDAERQDVLAQLDDFDLDSMMAAANKAQAAAKAAFADFQQQQQHGMPIDSPVSGVSAASGAQVEQAGKASRWFTRLTKGDAYFEIPSYPLDAQPNPDKITHIDADLRECTGPILDQAQCGACYAFSWNSYAEWHYCKQRGGLERVNFSEQHIVDCGYLAKLGGCVDGYLKNVREFSHTFGFVREQDYPYKGKQGKCKKAQGDIKVKTIDFKRVRVDRAEWEQMLHEQPILLEVHLPRDILSYSRGVHPGHNCDAKFAHGMLLIGHGRQDGVPYWLLKNSMGAKWGENGYLRLSRDAPMHECFRTGFISKFKFQTIDEEKFDEFYSSLSFEPSVQPETTLATAGLL